MRCWMDLGFGGCGEWDAVSRLAERREGNLNERACGTSLCFLKIWLALAYRALSILIEVGIGTGNQAAVGNPIANSSGRAL